jgi:hypothetical protein
MISNFDKMWQLVSRPFQKSSIQRRTIQTKTTESHVCGIEKMFLSSGDCEILVNFEQLLFSNPNFQIFVDAELEKEFK